MRSSTSNFKRRLRLPRLFFKRPPEIESIHGGPPLEYVRPVPELPWRGVTIAVVLIVIAAASGWELYCRSIGYGPTLNDSADLWTSARRRVKPDSVVVIGDSRAWFDLDLDELQKGLGKRPVQLAMGGSCAYPVLLDLANDTSFHGTVICSVVPQLFMAPAGTPPMDRSEKAVRRSQTQTLAQRASQYLAIPLEEHVAFLKQEELTLNDLLQRLPLPNRPYALAPPRIPPYFGTLDRERRARMIEECARPGKLQSTIQQIWLPLFTPPPPPSYIPKQEFAKQMGQAIQQRFHDVTAAVEKLRSRGCKVVFIRFPHSGGLKALEDRLTPRAAVWDRIIRDTAAPGIYYQDFADLASFNCPEWSHLSAKDSVEFSKRLVPHLRAALKM